MIRADDVLPVPVEWGTAAELAAGDSIFAPLRETYPDFDAWLAKTRTENRPALILRDNLGTVAVLIAKVEPEALKICTLIVREDVRNQGIGAALVRQALVLARTRGLPRVWATAFANPVAESALAIAGLGAESQMPSGELVLARPVDRRGAVQLFHERMGQIVGEGFAWRDEDLRRFLRHEELREVAETLREGDLVSIAGELTDVIYVTYGDAVACGFDLSTPAAPIHLHRPALPAPEVVEELIIRLERAGAAVDAVWAARGSEAEARAVYDELVAATDAAADACGLDLGPILAEVGRANLAKEAVAGGKARKPTGWQPPRLARVLEAEALEHEAVYVGTRPDTDSLRRAQVELNGRFAARQIATAFGLENRLDSAT